MRNRSQAAIDQNLPSPFGRGAGGESDSSVPTRPLWRWLLIGLCVLIFCSCRAPMPDSCNVSSATAQSHGGLASAARASRTSSPSARPAATLPAEAYSGVSPQEAAVAPLPIGPFGMEAGVPLPYAAIPPWMPPGITAGPWPADEYICDGGQLGPLARVGPQGEVYGLHTEDTIAHFDTVDGETLVEPSNRVCIYSPRFGSVRQVVSLVANEQTNHTLAVNTPAKSGHYDESLPALGTRQQVLIEGQIGARPPIVVLSKQGQGIISKGIGPRGFQDAFKPYENLSILRTGEYTGSEMAFLARGSNAAVAWTRTDQVQVVLDRKAAEGLVRDEKAEAVYSVGQPPGCPRLRLVKVASTPFAQPGDEVSFTLRFDNVGSQVIGNVTIIDSLSPRLEYIDGSAQCSRDAQFSTQPNESDSLVVRCELSKPLPAGKGGVVRFRCKVR
jgi:uncharacterized repeat protein (TIGR01451 family)